MDVSNYFTKKQLKYRKYFLSQLQSRWGEEKLFEKGRGVTIRKTIKKSMKRK